MMPSHEFLQRAPHSIREKGFRKAVLRMFAYPLKERLAKYLQFLTASII
jgi:hypothetical protein